MIRSRPTTVSRHPGPALETQLWVSAGTASMGDGLRLAALPLAIAAITRDPLQVAGLTVAQRVPALLFALPAGVILDRVDSFGVLVACQRFRVVLMVLLAGAVGARELVSSDLALAAVYLLAALLASIEVFGDVAAQVVVQLMVVGDRLEHINSRVVAGQLLGEEFLGPPAGGWLFELGRWPAFVGASLAYASSALILSRRSRTATTGERPEPHADSVDLKALVDPADGATGPLARLGWRNATTGMAGEARHGLAVVVGDRQLLVQAAWTSAMNAGNGMVAAVFVLFALEDLHLAGAAYGGLLTAGGIGGVLGAMGAGRLGRLVPRAVLMLTTSLLASLCTLALGGAHNFATVFALQGFAAFCGVLFSVIARSYRQSITPPEFAGRTTSVYRLLSLGSVPLGAVVGGVLGSAQGPRSAIVVGGTVMLVGTLGAAPFLRKSSTDVAERPELL